MYIIIIMILNLIYLGVFFNDIEVSLIIRLINIFMLYDIICFNLYFKWNFYIYDILFMSEGIGDNIY